MAGVTKGIGNRLYKFQKPNRWTAGIGAELPEEYRKFWREWKIQQPTPVHYIPKEGKYELTKDGQIRPIQNVPLPLKFPKEIDEGIWGGEAVVMGFFKKHKFKRRFRKYWVPQLKKSVVHSEILNKYMRMVVTNRTLQLIHNHYGFDHYILKTQACDLRSLLALKLKREMLISLYDKTLYPDDPVRKDEIYTKYKNYLEGYSREDIEWYGLSYAEATRKWIKMKQDGYNPEPLKISLRKEFLKYLEQQKIELNDEKLKSGDRSWISKLNPFGGSKSSTTS